MSLISNNLKFLRKGLSLTQEQLALKLGIKRSVLGAYEEGRAEPGLTNLQLFSNVFNVSIDDLVSIDFSQAKEANDTTDGTKIDVEGKRLRILTITVDAQEKEGIQLVPQKAAAGYLNGYQDPEFISDLPSFVLPTFQNGTFRAFEIKGDSMLPLATGTVIIGQYVDNWNAIKDGKTYVVVSSDEGIVYKRVYTKPNGLLLRSDNIVYDEYTLTFDKVVEVWEAKAFLSKEFPDPDMSVEKLGAMMKDLQQEITSMKK
jgi:transcriptional regulator with XRE-family HTH domain